MNRVFVVFIYLLAVSLVAGAAHATDTSWWINIKAVNPTTFGGGSHITLGVGTTTSSTQSAPGAVGSTATAEKTGADTGYHSRHDMYFGTRMGRRLTPGIWKSGRVLTTRRQRSTSASGTTRRRWPATAVNSTTHWPTRYTRETPFWPGSVMRQPRRHSKG